MVFCNTVPAALDDSIVKVTILILIDGFLQYTISNDIYEQICSVTILILIDGFLQCDYTSYIAEAIKSQSLF